MEYVMWTAALQLYSTEYGDSVWVFDARVIMPSGPLLHSCRHINNLTCKMTRITESVRVNPPESAQGEAMPSGGLEDEQIPIEQGAPSFID